MAQGQEANGDKLGNCFRSSIQLGVLMSTNNIQFHDRIRKLPLLFVFLNYRKNFIGTQKRVRISHCKRAIGVRVIEVRLYFRNIMRN